MRTAIVQADGDALARAITIGFEISFGIADTQGAVMHDLIEQ